MSKGYVLVTGASSGIGEATAAHLASLGFNVFAGVRRPDDGERVAGPRIEPVIIDVTDDASVASAARTIVSAVGATGLAGLVNNAGIAVACPLDQPLTWQPPELRTGTRPEAALVRRVQQRLRDLGYAEVGAPDGLFGDATRETVRAFQQAADLPTTGQVDCATALALFDAQATRKA